MTFQDAQDYIFDMMNRPVREGFFKRSKTAVYEADLRLLFETVGNPQNRLPHVVHVTGTSGKGSTATYIASILQAAGYKTALFTSPHLTSITERFRINGSPIAPERFASLIESLKPKYEQFIEQSESKRLRYFDLLTAAAMTYFAEEQVDYAVLEVGIGGRYDATNIVPKKDAAVITTIGLDHTEILGDTKEAIASKKAGIIKPGCQVFTGVEEPSVLAVIQDECDAQGIDMLNTVQDISRVSVSLDGTTLDYNGHSYTVQAIGAHQARNAALARDVTSALGCSEQAISDGLCSAVQPIRFEVMQRDPLVILDGAHNSQKMASTIAALRAVIDLDATDLHLVISFTSKSHTANMIAMLSELKPASISCTLNPNKPDRSIAFAERLATQFSSYLPDTEICCFQDPKEAFDWSLQKAKTRGVVLATGSIYMSGELRRFFS